MGYSLWPDLDMQMTLNQPNSLPLTELYEEVKKVSPTISSCTGTRSEKQLLALYLEAEQYIDRTEAIKTSNIKLSRWYDAKLYAETTVSTAAIYRDQLLKAYAPEKMMCGNNWLLSNCKVLTKSTWLRLAAFQELRVVPPGFLSGAERERTIYHSSPDGW